jgi:hypothetical protein
LGDLSEVSVAAAISMPTSKRILQGVTGLNVKTNNESANFNILIDALLV